MTEPSTGAHGSVSTGEADAASEGSSTPGSRRPFTWRSILVVLAALAIGIGGTLTALAAFTGDAPDSPDAPVLGTASLEDRTAASDPETLQDAGFRDLPAAPTEIPDAPPTDPLDAVTGFLTAEAQKDFEASYEFLAADERALYGSPAGWVAAHADVLPPVTAFEIGETSEEAGAIQVESVVGFVPSLDEIVGLIPAQAEVIWSVAQDGERFGVSLESSSFAPVYLEEDTAAEATRAWVASRQDCASEGEWGGTLFGVRAPVQALCDAEGEPAVGEPGPLPQLEATPFVGAFGEEALTWSRVVEVTAPVPMRVVLAPIGAGWQVIGVLPAGGIGTAPEG